MSVDGVEGRGHLRRLLFDGPAGSTGSYTPHRVDLRLAGTDAVQDVVVRLHEVHHQVLNDATAWGTALHVFARTGPADEQAFDDLVDAARLTHESFATFASVSTVQARHVDAEDVLGAYPLYEPLYRATVRMLSAVTGRHRQYLAATAVARVAMQTPVLDVLSGRPGEFQLSMLRSIDTPDARWRWVEQRRGLLADAAAGADEHVRSTIGPDALAADSGEDRDAPADDAHDVAWAAWEHHVYDRLAAALESAGAIVLPYDGHRLAAEKVVTAVRATHPGIGVWADSSAPAPDDRALAAAAIADTGVHLAPVPWRAAVIDGDVPDIVGHRSSYLIGGVPSMIVDVRLPHRLRDLFRWEPGHDDEFVAGSSPVAMCRLMGDDDGDDIVLNVPIVDVAGLEELAEAWHDRGPFVSLVAAGCFVDRAWTAEWLPVLERVGSVVVLVDVEVDRFVGNWARADVSVAGSNLEIADTSLGSRHAVVFRSSNSPVLWLYVGDEVTSRLLTHVVAATPGVDLRLGNALAEDEAGLLRIAVTHVLGTESFTDLAGLSGLL